jgi:hypothetical protein
MTVPRRCLWFICGSVAVSTALLPRFSSAQNVALSVPESVSVERVNCRESLCRGLAHVLLGPVVSKATAGFLLGNWGTAPATIVTIRLVAVGDVSGAFWEAEGNGRSQAEIRPRGQVNIRPWVLDSMSAELIPLGLPPLDTLRAGRYSGEIRVMAAGATESLKTSFSLSVRKGPWQVLLWLLVGLLLGRWLLKINKADPSGADGAKPKMYPSLSGFVWEKGKPDRLGGLSLITGVAWTRQASKNPQFRTRAGASLLLLAVAVYEGLKLLYLDDVTFGDDGLLDYLVVFAWGFAADGGQRFITNLGWKPGPTR